jgi:hypothetical protein
MPGMEGQDSSTGNIGGNPVGSVRHFCLLFCSRKNNSPHKELPCKVGTSPEKSGGMRKSPSQGNGGVAIHPLFSTRLQGVALRYLARERDIVITLLEGIKR